MFDGYLNTGRYENNPKKRSEEEHVLAYLGTTRFACLHKENDFGWCTLTDTKHRFCVILTTYNEIKKNVHMNTEQGT